MALRFGVSASGVSRSDATALEDFLASLSRLLLLPVEGATFKTYDELAGAVSSGEVDFAWLPPILLIGLEQREQAVAIASLRLDAPTMYTSVLITRADSSIAKLTDIVGMRMGWVDRWSASGYVVPRLAIAAAGIDPRGAFVGEEFFGSHEAVSRAVIEGRIDVGATYGRAGPTGVVESGAWNAVAAPRAVRVISSWGPVPSDVLAVRPMLDPTTATALRRSLLVMGRDERGKAVIRRLFGTAEIQPWVSETYDAVRDAMTDAIKRGLLEELRG